MDTKTNKSFEIYVSIHKYLIYILIPSALFLIYADKHGAHFGWGFLPTIILFGFIGLSGLLFVLDFFYLLIRAIRTKDNNQDTIGLLLIVDFVAAFGIYFYLQWILGQ